MVGIVGIVVLRVSRARVVLVLIDGKNNCRSFDYGAHDKTVSTFAQDDTS
jgi:hypothetical protein